MDSECSLSPVKQRMSGCNWTQLLTAKNGPGEVPGRVAAVSEAVAAIAEKKRLKAAFAELKASKKRRGR